MVGFNLTWDDINLPRVGWLGNVVANPGLILAGTSDSAFIIAAKESHLRGLSDFTTVGLVISAITAANTTLYVASRTLFSLTRGIDATANSPLIHQFFAFLGKTNRRQVPMRAIVASCCFCWIPFLYLSKSNGSGTTIGAVRLCLQVLHLRSAADELQRFQILVVLSDMGSVSCIMVWTIECLAFIRFYHWCASSLIVGLIGQTAKESSIKRHRSEIERREVRFLRRFAFGQQDDYPYRSHGQPFTAYITVAGCLFILIVANSASLWTRFRTQPFLSAYLAVSQRPYPPRTRATAACRTAWVSISADAWH